MGSVSVPSRKDCWVRLHKGTKTATGYSIICWNYFYFSRQVEKTPEIDARESPLRLIAVHTLACIVGHINVLGEYDFSEKVSAKLPTSSHPKNTVAKGRERERQL